MKNYEMAMTVFKTSAFAAIFITLFTACMNIKHREHTARIGKISIDESEWTLVLRPSHCENYIDVATEEYLKHPIYNPIRPLSYERFLENNEGECWVEIVIVGTSTFSFLFRVNSNMQVIDKRMLSKRSPYIQDYPPEPYEK